MLGDLGQSLEGGQAEGAADSVVGVGHSPTLGTELNIDGFFHGW